MAQGKSCFATSGGSQFVNFANGTCRVTAAGERMDTHKIGIYSAEVTVPETGISIPIDTILGRTKEINDIFNHKGQYSGSTTGKDILIDKTMSVTFSQDFMYFNQLTVEQGSEAYARDTLRALILADAFAVDDSVFGGTTNKDIVVKVAGTNGVVKRGRSAVSDLNFGALFHNDGRLIVPQASDENGEPILEPNSRVGAYNTTALTTMLEFIYEYSSSKKSGFRIVYCLNGELTYTEADDVNKYQFNTQMLSDVFDCNGFYFAGGNAVKALIPPATGTGAPIVNPALTGREGFYYVDKAADISVSTSGIISGAAYDAVKAAAIKSGSKLKAHVFYCKNGIKAGTGTANTNPCMVATCSDITVGQAICSVLDTKVPGGEAKGTKAEDYTFAIYDFSLTDGKFVPAS